MQNIPIKPFVEQGNYIAVHRVLFDVVMPTLSPNAWKILSLLIRQTVGWHKNFDVISYEQIRVGTGIRSDATISRALHELQGEVPILEQKKLLGWLRIETMPVLIKCQQGEQRFDKTREPNCYFLNADVELLQPTVSVECPKPHYKNCRGNKEPNNRRGSDSREVIPPLGLPNGNSQIYPRESDEELFPDHGPDEDYWKRARYEG